MRRTYRSKKETGGALDHKEAIQALDEKSSAFDAFYIQNIKQTKRDLSCIGSSNHYGAAANKVRKRKYVKRIVKDPEPTVEFSPSHSVFLTPDKSIRVNKAQDLFDQLLNSPRIESPWNSRPNVGKFPSRQEGKTYNKKKLAKIKKFNCSISDSIESDKENSNESGIQNVTDLCSYELLIEKEKKHSPKYLDESINKIAKNISLLHSADFHRVNSIGSTNKTLDVKHRLTTNIQSPSNSPLCSTPFKEKYRSQSIFKFSPIVFGKNNTTPSHSAILEENTDDSVVCVEKKQESFKVSYSEQANALSPIIHLSTDKYKKSDSGTNSTNSDIQLSSHHNTLEENHPEKDKSDDNKVEICSIEISDLQTTEPEPFFGFSNVQNLEYQVDSVANENSIHNETNISENESEDDRFKDSRSIIENDSHNESSIKTDITLAEIEEAENDNDSSYDTCNSEQYSQCVDKNTIKVPVVKIEKLNDSVLKQYLKDVVSSDSEGGTELDVSNLTESDDYASLEAASFTESSRDNSNITLSTDYEEDLHTDTSGVTNSEDLSYNNEEERCISFVTTRRRNEMTNNSLIFNFDNSFDSPSSTDCDKTVLSNKENNTLKSSISPNLELKRVDNPTDNLTLIAECKHDISNEVNETNTQGNETSIARRSAKLVEDNIESKLRESMVEEGKPGIVLQPGKKWERSLSIYRRMTMMTDSFDKSILDADEFQTKGRKYRQSVISTMELQDKGSLHNESIISRRSTFVSKPCRSTIRIIKEPNSSRLSLCTTAVSDDLRGFLNEDCDDTIIELSKLSIADSEHEVTVIENLHDTSNRVSTARDYVLRRCTQTDAILFDECYPETVLKNCRKIGEGVYGEVYLWRAGDGRARVMKIVPIAGNTKVNGEHQKDFHEIISEIVIAMELSALRTPIDEIQREFDEGTAIDALDLHSVENATDVFNQVLAVRCVYGTYPARLLDLWELYDECNGSENDNPAILPAEQQYIVLELANAGQDLESYEFNSAEQAHALFLQVAFGLAVGEEAFQFEHRDLHWGNVLIAPTDQKFATFVLRGRAYRVPRRGVAGTIIDYSLSRLSLPLAGAGDAAALYNDLAADDGLFDAVGDYQFQVYRLMRDKLGNDWKNFEPYTNILWLHYTVDKMITALRYKRTNTKIHKHYIAKLKGIKNRLLEYGSAAQFVLTDNEF